MRSSLVISAVLLAFGAWSMTTASSGLEFTDQTPAPVTEKQVQAPDQAQVPAMMPAGDVARGKAIWDSTCRRCHSLDANKIGPAHRGVVGRVAGTAPGYAYSDGVKASGITWTPETLDIWLVNPQTLIEGAKMNYRLKDPQMRADVIAYLASEK